MGTSSVNSHNAARDVREHECAESDRKVGAIASGVAVDRVDVAAGEVANAGPHRDPQCRADRVADQEFRPAHARGAGDNAVGLAQALNEPRDDDDLAAMAVEETGGLLKAFGRKEDVAAIALDQPASAEVAD